MRTALSVFVAGFLRLNANGLAHPSPFLSVLSPILSFYRLFIMNCGIVAGFLRPNSYSFADPFLFPFLSLSLMCLLFIFMWQRRFRFRLNCAFVTAFFRLNAYGFIDPSPFLYVLSAIFLSIGPYCLLFLCVALTSFN
jgi:hypothetical protein